MMTKKDFIALADTIRAHNTQTLYVGVAHDACFLSPHLKTLAAFCHSCDPRFNHERWLDYIRGECGPNGGAIHRPKGGPS